MITDIIVTNNAGTMSLLNHLCGCIAGGRHD